MKALISKLFGSVAQFFTIEDDASYMTGFTKVLVVFLSIFFTWMILAPIKSSVIAAGEIVVSSQRKQVQHLEGGIIQTIHVKEGGRVIIGDPLITLDTTAIQIQITQINEGIRAANYQREATWKLIETLTQELAIVDRLLEHNNTSLTRKLDLQKQLNQANATLGEVESTIARLNSEIVVNQDQLRRSIVRAPVSGFVMALQQHTVGGVIAPGGALMDIVPNDDALVAEVKVKPEDIDLLRVGLTAKVQLVAFNTNLMPKLNGEVIGISADSFKNEMTGEVYFNVRIQIPDDELAQLKETIQLLPGMPVNTFIITGSRTLFMYLITPIRESAYKAFRET